MMLMASAADAEDDERDPEGRVAWLGTSNEKTGYCTDRRDG
jgi:hypothetical protein